MHSKKIA